MEPLSITNMGPVAPGPLVPTTEKNQANSMEPLVAYPRLTPRSSDNYAVQFNMSQAMHDQLCYAQALLGHAAPSRDLAELFERALNLLVGQLERQKFAKASLERPSRGSANPHYIPAEVRRAVWRRDGGQCTFVGTGGTSCGARDGVQYDHVQPVARGGESTVANVRLLCPAHNQYEAERVLGADFMEAKREAAAKPSESAATLAPSQDLMPRLVELGLSAEQAAQAAARCGSIPGVPFEERLTLALRGFAPASVRLAAATTGSTLSHTKECR